MILIMISITMNDLKELNSFLKLNVTFTKITIPILITGLNW